MQTQESNETEQVQEELTKLGCRRDAIVVAAFYRQLIVERIPEDIAKDLTIAYIVKPNPFGQ